MRVTQQRVFHFRQREPSDAWPVLVFKDEADADVRPALPEVTGARRDERRRRTRPRYFLDHGRHPHRRRRVRPRAPRVGDFVRDRLPGLDSVPVAESDLSLHDHPGRGLRPGPPRQPRHRLLVLRTRREVRTAPSARWRPTSPPAAPSPTPASACAARHRMRR
ncbi:hypothetical protein ACRAWF_46325 [Streptomyces sp. L7]